MEKINENLEKIYFNITSFNGLKLKYFSFVEDDEKEEMKLKFYQKLKENIKKEIFYKTSLFGPHRDDFSLELDGKNLLLYGSQGQNRCAILALKLAEIPIFKSILNVNPILLLDDVFSELDTKKKNSLIEFIPKDIQTMITTTDLNLINDKLLEDSTVYMIENGKIISKLIHDERKS